MPRLLAALGVLTLVALLWFAFGSNPPPTDQGSGSQRPKPSTTSPASGANAESPTAAAPSSAPQRLSATGSQGFKGTITDPDGKPIASAVVAVVTRPTADPLSTLARSRRGLRTAPLAATTTGADGAFALPLTADLESRLEVHAYADGFGSSSRRDLVSPQGEWRDLGAITLQRGLEVFGRVVDQAGNAPIADATVTALSAEQKDLFLPGRENGMTTRSDAEGRYRIGGLSEGSFVIAAVAPGHGRVELPMQHADGTEANELDIGLPAGWSLAGSVVDEQGRGIADAFVTGEGGAPARVTARCNPDGTFVLDGIWKGAVTAIAAAPGHAEVTLGPLAPEAGSVRFVLPRLGGIAVHVRDADGRQLDRFVAIARGHADAPPLSLRRSQPCVAEPEKLIAGALTVPDLQAGEYVVEIEAAGHAKTRSQPCTVRDRELTAIEVQLRRGGRLRGRVTDAAGTPVRGANVATRDPRSRDGELGTAVGTLTGSRLSLRNARTGNDGSFVLEHLAAGDYRLIVVDENFAPQTRAGVHIEEGGDHDLGAIALQRGATLSGRVLVDGEPQRTVVVQLLALDNESPTTNALESGVDATGRFTFKQRLPPGHYAVLAGRRDPRNPVQENADRQQSRVEIEVGAGEQRSVDLTIKGP